MIWFMFLLNSIALRFSLLKSYKKGDEMTCIVLTIDLEKERINLGVKQIDEGSSADEVDNENSAE